MKRIIVFFILLLLLLFLMSCHQHKHYDQLNRSIKKYLYVWNGGNIDSLNSITSENFQLRMNPSFEPANGREKLKESILQTRSLFPDFNVNEKEINILSDTALVITWIINGSYRNPQDSFANGRKTEASGFSVIFFHNGILTGEWIGYSDLTWYKGLGYEMMVPEKKGK